MTHMARPRHRSPPLASKAAGDVCPSPGATYQNLRSQACHLESEQASARCTNAGKDSWNGEAKILNDRNVKPGLQSGLKLFTGPRYGAMACKCFWRFERLCRIEPVN